MNKKIAFFTEMSGYGKIQRNHANMKTMEAWICALNAQHIPLMSGYSPNADSSYSFDLGIVVVPKNWFKLGDELLVNYVENIVKKSCKKIAVMQEGPNYYFQDFDVNKQIWYFQILEMADFLLCHNEYDVDYYKGLTGKNVYQLQSLMITDNIKEEAKQEAVMIGGNFCSWYGGFDSWMVAREMQVKMYAPSMGRKQKDENDIITEVNYLPYLNWNDWMLFLSQMKYGVHLMRTYAAGTFALNCAYLGIPCIGYENLDTQKKLHFSTTVEEGNIEQAIFLAKELVKNKDFYDECSVKARIDYEKNYSEKIFLEKFKEILKKENI